MRAERLKVAPMKNAIYIFLNIFSVVSHTLAANSFFSLCFMKIYTGSKKTRGFATNSSMISGNMNLARYTLQIMRMIAHTLSIDWVLETGFFISFNSKLAEHK